MPYRLDIFAIFIFLGIVQGLFLAAFLFLKWNSKQFNVFQGCLLLSISLALLEIFLMYTGYIQNILFLVDFSEPIGLCIGPFAFLYVRSLIKGNLPRKTIAAHLIFPLLNALLMVPYYLAPEAVKYNSWITAYHPGEPYRDIGSYSGELLFDRHNTFLVIATIGVYVFLSLLQIRKALVLKNESFMHPRTPILRSLRVSVIQLFVIVLIILLVKFFNVNDTGDHLIAVAAALAVYFTSFSIIANSSFFHQIPVQEDVKYKNSGLEKNELERIGKALQALMITEKPYRESDFSVPKLAKLSNNQPHIVSQVINEQFQKSFFEWIADYRIEDAKQILKDSPHLKIEEVADAVGYNSKSSFNTVFKKLTSMTPSEFRSKATA